MRLSPAIPILLLLVAGPCLGDDHDVADRLREQGQLLPLEELLRRAGLGADVRILEVESKGKHGRQAYEIEYVDSGGRIREVLIDAGTGEVLREEED
jgi:uncharacterized membrane protein YkoI